MCNERKINRVFALLVVVGVVSICTAVVTPVKADVLSMAKSVPILVYELAVVPPPVTASSAPVIDVQTVFDQLMTWDVEFAALAPISLPGPGQDFVAGSLRVTVPATGDFQHVRISAHSGPSGEDPTGSVRATTTFSPFGAFDLRGDVTCVDVTGNNAFVAARLGEPFMGYTHVTLHLVDNGNPGATMGESPDLAFIGFISAPPSTCHVSGFSLLGDQSGNLVVKDAL